MKRKNGTKYVKYYIFDLLGKFSKEGVCGMPHAPLYRRFCISVTIFCVPTLVLAATIAVSLIAACRRHVILQQTRSKRKTMNINYLPAS